MSWLSEWFGKVASGKKPKEAAVEVVSEKIVKAIDAVDEPNWAASTISEIAEYGDCRRLAERIRAELVTVIQHYAVTKLCDGADEQAIAELSAIVLELAKVQK